MAENSENAVEKPCRRKNNNCTPFGAVYGFGIIGAAIYYISSAVTFWAGLLGLLKAFIWPVFLIYEALRFLGQ